MYSKHDHMNWQTGEDPGGCKSRVIGDEYGDITEVAISIEIRNS